MLEHAPEVLLIFNTKLKLDRFFHGYDEAPKPRKIILDLRQRNQVNGDFL